MQYYIAIDYSSIIGYAAAVRAVPAKYKYRSTHTTTNKYENTNRGILNWDEL